MKEKSTVSWFEVRKDATRFRVAKWIVAIFSAIFLNWFYMNGLPASKGIRELVEAKTEETLLEIEVIEEEEIPQYVETNPDNPINDPDDTNQISDRSQQAAQEDVAGPDKNPTPFLEGDDENSNKIIEGQMPSEAINGQQAPEVRGQQAKETPQKQLNQEPQEAQEEKKKVLAQPESIPSIEAPSIHDQLPEISPPPPTPDFIEEIKSDNEDGLDLKVIKEKDYKVEQYSNHEGENQRININLPPSVAAALSKAIEEQKAQEKKHKQEADEQSQSQNPIAQTKPSPRPRPRISPKVLPGPRLSSQVYAARMGPIGYDAKFSQFGHYLSRMFDTIQMQWYSLLNDVTIGQDKRPSTVVVEFELGKDGQVIDSNVISTNAGDLATILCKDAIESRAPFGLWTEQMVDQLGDQTTITLRFIYL